MASGVLDRSYWNLDTTGTSSSTRIVPEERVSRIMQAVNLGIPGFDPHRLDQHLVHKEIRVVLGDYLGALVAGKSVISSDTYLKIKQLIEEISAPQPPAFRGAVERAVRHQIYMILGEKYWDAKDPKHPRKLHHETATYLKFILTRAHQLDFPVYERITKKKEAIIPERSLEILKDAVYNHSHNFTPFQIDRNPIHIEIGKLLTNHLWYQIPAGDVLTKESVKKIEKLVDEISHAQYSQSDETELLLEKAARYHIHRELSRKFGGSRDAYTNAALNSILTKGEVLLRPEPSSSSKPESYKIPEGSTFYREEMPS